MALSGTVQGVCVGQVRELVSGSRRIETAFVKTPVAGPIRFGPLGLPGDEHVYEDHGGPDMAVLVHPLEHYAYWRGLGLELADVGALAENLTVSGLVETDVRIGDIFAVGTGVVQVCQPRRPCFKLAARFGRRDLPIVMQDTGFTGYHLRVLSEGELSAGDTMVLIDRDSSHDITVAEAARIINVDRNDLDGARRLLRIPALGSLVRLILATRIEDQATLGLEVERLFHPEDQPVP